MEEVEGPIELVVERGRRPKDGARERDVVEEERLPGIRPEQVISTL